MITLKELKEILSYDPHSGEWTWRTGRPGRGCVAGCKAGSVNGIGYYCITIDWKGYLAHRLAWLYMTGKWPILEIDHIDGDTTNNQFANLREATSSQNSANSAKHKDNQTGFKGVRKCRRKWQAHIMVNGITYYLGSFASPEEAHIAYCEAAKKLHGEFARAA